MTIDKVIVTLVGLILSFATYRFFFSKSEKVASIVNEVTITVDGGYSPNVIKVKKNKKILIRFLRKDPSSCLEEVVIPEFGKKLYLSLNQVATIEIDTVKSGEFIISCGMNMYHAKIVVE